MVFKKSLILTFALFAISETHHSEKRSLLFPPASVLQVSCGVSSPLILPKRSIPLTLGVQANFQLPYNNSQLMPTIISRSVEDFDLDRQTFYKYIEEFLNGFGLNGENCLSRSICEVAKIPMYIEESNSLLEHIVHYLLTPSEGNSMAFLGNSSCDSSAYLDAEYLGKSPTKCHDVYSECPMSLLALFTKMFNV